MTNEAGGDAPSAAAGDSPAGRSGTQPKRVRATDGQVGQTLRTVYQQTVNEDIPADLLDLLGKLA